MRNGGRKIFEALDYTQTCNIIALIEKGLEVTKLENIASNDDDTRDQIDDGEMILTFLHLRKFGE